MHFSTGMPPSSRQHRVTWSVATPWFLMLKYAKVATHLSIRSFNRLYSATKLNKSQATFLKKIPKICLPAPRVPLLIYRIPTRSNEMLGSRHQGMQNEQTCGLAMGKVNGYVGLISRGITSRRKEVPIVLYSYL